jgi:hypothetical protein
MALYYPIQGWKYMVKLIGVAIQSPCGHEQIYPGRLKIGPEVQNPVALASAIMWTEALEIPHDVDKVYLETLHHPHSISGDMFGNPLAYSHKLNKYLVLVGQQIQYRGTHTQLSLDC